MDAFRSIRHVAVAFAAGAALTLLLSAAFLSFVWIAGGLRTEGSHLDWNVVIGLGTILTAAAAIGALGAIGAGIDQLRSTKRNERMALLPYLRVDLGLLNVPEIQPGLRIPREAHVFDTHDFSPGVDMSDLEDILATDNEAELELGLWVTNKQSAPLGAAYQIEIGLAIAWSYQDGVTGEVLEAAAESVVRFTYVEPGAITVLRLARLRASVPELIVAVTSVTYHGMYLDKALRNRHGALNLYYQADAKRIQNERSYGLSEKP